MKNYLFVVLVLISTSIFAQSVQFLGTKNLLETIYLKNIGEIKISEIEGSPYVNKKFETALISENYEPISARYNNYSDKIEFQRDDQVYILDNDGKFPVIQFEDSKEELHYFENESEGLTGYFYELYRGSKVSLYKKVVIGLQEPKRAKNSYAEDKPALFLQPEDFYYFKVDSGLIRVPSRTKEYQDVLPNMKDSVQKYLKQNKINSKNPADLVKFVKYLN